MFSDIDIDGLEFSQFKVLKEVLHIERNNPLDILNYIKKVDSFPNVFVTYKILLTVHGTAAFVERSLSKLKLLKSYLRTTMSQAKLNGLAILAIKKI